MWKIKKVEIINLWEEKDLSIEFNSELNILIGSNGTGKTTILKILEAAFKLDSYYFKELMFDSIKILLVDDKKQQTLKIINKEGVVKFFVANKNIYEYSDIRKKPTYSDRFIQENLREMKIRQNIIKEYEFPKIKSLPTNRVSKDDFYETDDYFMVKNKLKEYENSGTMDSVDYKLRQLLEKLNEKISYINQKILKVDRNFRDNMVKKNFYAVTNDVTDSFSQVINRLKLTEEREKLLIKLNQICKIFEVQEINTYQITEIEKILNKKSFTIADVMKISAYSFLINYEESYDEYSSQITELNSPLEKFKKMFEIMFGTKFTIELTNKFTLLKRCGESSKEFIIEKFSSGEKQMLIFILECLFLIEDECVYLTDEPEISLHLIWQQKYIDLLLKTNKNNQFIIATHSPDIVGKYKENIIKLNSQVVDCAGI